jgi:hypothetical protein
MELRFGLHDPLSKSQVDLLNAVRKSEIHTFGWPIAVTLETWGPGSKSFSETRNDLTWNSRNFFYFNYVIAEAMGRALHCNSKSNMVFSSGIPVRSAGQALRSFP